MVRRACSAPLRTIVKNSGKSPDVVIEMLRSQRLMSDIQYPGWNAATGEIVDMISSGIIDPLKVTRTALENAASVAGTFLSLDAVVYEVK